MPTYGRRTRTALCAGAAILGILTLNVAGVLAYPGGPLRDPGIDAPLLLDVGGSERGVSVSNATTSEWAVSHTRLYYGLLTLHDPWPWDATIESIEPVHPSPNLVVDGIYLRRPGYSGATTALGSSVALPEGKSFDDVYAPLPAQVKPGGPTAEQDGVVLLVIRTETPLAMQFDGLAVTYRVGPFTFRTVQHVGLRSCVAPQPGEPACTDEATD
jgi:hypothetical protein